MFDQIALQPEKIHLREFQILSGQVHSPADFKMKAINGYLSDVGFEMAFNLKKKWIKADIQIKAQTDSAGKNKEEADGFFHIAFFYEVENLDDLAKETDPNVLQIHPGLANAIASISYSTARGIILTRFQGTALRGFILPVIDPNGLVKNGAKGENP
ncbi:MAG: hypothetical protein R3D58_18325 [Saprospiraceae bacterium]